MIKFMSILVCLMCVTISSTVHAQKHIRIDEKSEKRDVCGLTVAKKSGLVIDALRISENSLHNHIDNERYNACPYWVTLNYQGLKLRIDFSNDGLLDQVKNFEDGDGSAVNFGVFKYDKNGWHDESGIYESPKKNISVKNSENSLLIVGSGIRKGASPGIVEDCVGLLIVGNVVSAGGGICTVKKTSLVPLQTLFKGVPVLSFEKNKIR